MNPQNRMVAILEAEARMIESHVNKLGEMAKVTGNDWNRHELLRLAEEERTRARNIRHQVCLIRDHLDHDGSKAS